MSHDTAQTLRKVREDLKAGNLGAGAAKIAADVLKIALDASQGWMRRSVACCIAHLVSLSI